MTLAQRCGPGKRPARWAGRPGTFDPRPPIEIRFALNVIIGDGEDACWEWGGRRQKQGYGKLSDGPGNDVLAHRLAWTILIGPIPDGLHVLHRCDNPPCVRPAHLFLGTDADNTHDMIRKGRAAYQKRSQRVIREI